MKPTPANAGRTTDLRGVERLAVRSGCELPAVWGAKRILARDGLADIQGSEHSDSRRRTGPRARPPR